MFVELSTSFFPSVVGGDNSINYSLFLLISCLNLLGLSGGVALCAPWPTFVLVFSLSFWGLVMFQRLSFSAFSLASHFTPRGLSLLGSLPITLIEILGVLIRPLTLGIRLCANISGGHLIGELVEEIGGEAFSLSLIHFYESFVSIIQALIFSLLLYSYFKEIYWFSILVFFIYIKKEIQLSY